MKLRVKLRHNVPIVSEIVPKHRTFLLIEHEGITHCSIIAYEFSNGPRP